METDVIERQYRAGSAFEGLHFFRKEQGHMESSVQKKIFLGDTELACELAGNFHTQITANGKVIRSLNELINIYPQLKNDSHLEQLAQLANFLFSGNRYHVIKDIEKFKREYTERVEDERKSFLSPAQRISAFGVFDVSVISPPVTKDGKLMFYVYDDYRGLPYLVTCKWPVSSDSPEIFYDKLKNIPFTIQD